MNESTGMYGVPKPWYFLFVKAAERNYQEIEGSQENSGLIYILGI